jgi:hypothetical protein
MAIVVARFTDVNDNPIDLRFYRDGSNTYSLLSYKDPDDPSNKAQLYRSGGQVSSIISGVASRLLSLYVYNKSTAIRYIQFHNTSAGLTSGSSVPAITRVLAPGEKYDLGCDNFGGSEGYLFSTGLVWGFSTTEGVYTAGSGTDVSCEVFWRVN